MTDMWPGSAGELLHNILSGGEPRPGPPYTHTIVPAEVGLDEFKPYRVEYDEPAGCGCPGGCEGGPECLDDEGGPRSLSLPVLTSGDPQPPPGTVVRDDCGVTWERYGEDEGDYWLQVGGGADSDPESWAKIAGTYGPVTVLEWGEPEDGPW